jgi:hypothetical protein
MGIKNQDPDPESGSGIRIKDEHPRSYSEILETKLKFFDADPEAGNLF